MKGLLKKLRAEYWILVGILLFTFLMRFPSLFEPFWYGDEGIFAAVARNLNFGGVLYQDAWDNKPPMIYLTYQAIFKVFGVSMFWLRLATIVVVLATAAVIYEIGQKVFGTKRALFATFAFGFLTSLRIVEGNLALTEIFMILPISVAMMIAILRKFDLVSCFVAGVLFAVASLFKQVGALEAAALGIFLFLIAKNFGEFFKKSLFLVVGFCVPFLVTIAYFAPKNLVGEYIFAAYTYYQIYLGESPRYAILVNILKFSPIVAAVGYGLWKRSRDSIASLQNDKVSSRQAPPEAGQARTIRNLGLFHLLLLWSAFSFLGSYFSGRTYGHYLVQALPSVSLLLASISWRPMITRARLVFALSFFIPLIFLTKLLFTDFLSGGPLNQIKYWQNFAEFYLGKKSLAAYNDYFDKNVNSVMALADFFEARGARGSSVYIWGDWPWLYAISDLVSPSRYVTSFHVFGVPNGKEEIISKIRENPPDFIIKTKNSIGYFGELEMIIARKYTHALVVENSDVYTMKQVR